MQILAEGAVFGIVSVMAARFDEVPLAAHSIAVNVISITYMVPLGISSAAAVRVGQASGRRSPQGIAVSGWTALALAVGFMGAAGLALGFVPQWIARLYTPDVAVIAASGVIALPIMIYAAAPASTRTFTTPPTQQPIVIAVPIGNGTVALVGM